MADPINNGGPVYPVQEFNADGTPATLTLGITLRDYFAVHASDEDVKCQIEAIRSAQIKAGGIGVLADGWNVTARYMHADAMLKAREGGTR